MKSKLFAMLLLASIVACKKPAKESNSPKPQEKEESLIQGAEATPSAPVSTVAQVPWSQLSNYKITVLKKSDHKLASKEKYSLNYQIFMQNGVVYPSRQNLKKENGNVACEIEFAWTMFKSRRAFKEKESLVLANAQTSWESLSSVFGVRYGTVDTTDGRVKNIKCRKYSKDSELTVADLERALGTYVQVIRR